MPLDHINLDDILNKQINQYITQQGTKQEKEFHNYVQLQKNNPLAKYHTNLKDDKYQFLLEANKIDYKHREIPKPTHIMDQTRTIMKFMGAYQQ